MQKSYQIVSETVGPNSQEAMLARANLGILEAELSESKAGTADIGAARGRMVELFGLMTVADTPVPHGS